MKIFKMEFAVLLSVCLLFLQFRDRYKKFPNVIKFMHFTFILLFAEIGVAGLRSAIKLCAANARFFELFREGNLLSITPEVMCGIAVIYSIIGPVFFVAVMFLGQMSAKARKIFLLLVIPSSVFYPVIVGNLTRTTDALRSTKLGPMGILLVFAALGLSGVIFYCLKPISDEMDSTLAKVNCVGRIR